MIKNLLVGSLIGASALLALPATAQFTISGSGLNSAGDFGDVDNSQVSGTYAGPNTIFGSLNVSGVLDAVIAGTWGEDSVIGYTNNVSAAFGTVRPELTGSSYTTLSVNRTVGAMIWLNSGDDITVETFETIDDGAGADATWSQFSTTMSGGITTVDLGVLGSDVTFDSFLSTVDTEIAVYSADGILIDTNDDTAGGTNGLQSQVILTGLAAGKYYVVGGGFNAFFDNEFAIAGFTGDSEFGDFNLSIDGVFADAGTFGANEFAIYEFEVVPEPATMTVLALGAIAAFRRKRKA